MTLFVLFSGEVSCHLVWYVEITQVGVFRCLQGRNIYRDESYCKAGIARFTLNRLLPGYLKWDLWQTMKKCYFLYCLLLKTRQNISSKKKQTNIVIRKL